MKLKHICLNIMNSVSILTMKENDIGIFALALISKNLENLGIETAIVKDKISNEEKDDLVELNQGQQFVAEYTVNFFD